MLRVRVVRDVLCRVVRSCAREVCLWCVEGGEREGRGFRIRVLLLLLLLRSTNIRWCATHSLHYFSKFSISHVFHSLFVIYQFPILPAVRRFRVAASASGFGLPNLLSGLGAWHPSTLCVVLPLWSGIHAWGPVAQLRSISTMESTTRDGVSRVRTHEHVKCCVSVPVAVLDAGSSLGLSDAMCGSRERVHLLHGQILCLPLHKQQIGRDSGSNACLMNILVEPVSGWTGGSGGKVWNLLLVLLVLTLGVVPWLENNMFWHVLRVLEKCEGFLWQTRTVKPICNIDMYSPSRLGPRPSASDGTRPVGSVQHFETPISSLDHPLPMSSGFLNVKRNEFSKSNEVNWNFMKLK